MVGDVVEKNGAETYTHLRGMHAVHHRSKEIGRKSRNFVTWQERFKKPRYNEREYVHDILHQDHLLSVGKSCQVVGNYQDLWIGIGDIDQTIS